MAGDFISSTVTTVYYYYSLSHHHDLETFQPKGSHAMQKSCPKQIPVTTYNYSGIRRIRELTANSGYTCPTARGYHIHGSSQEPVKDFHGSPSLVSYGPVASIAPERWVGFFPGFMDPDSPFGILLAIYRTRV